VANPEEMWILHNLAETYGRRPSEIIGVDDEWAAYQLDVAALVLGRYVEGEVSKPKSKVDAAGVLARMRRGDAETRRRGDGAPSSHAAGKRSYRRLGYPGMPVMRIPESGIW
jgi:hypothetical protein